MNLSFFVTVPYDRIKLGKRNLCDSSVIIGVSMMYLKLKSE